MEKIKIKFDDFLSDLEKIDFGDFDMVVAIGRGGIVPGALIASLLNKEYHVLWLNFRDDAHKPKYKEPRVAHKIDFEHRNKKILLVDDVSRTGATLKKAKELLKADVKTFVVNGNADISMYNYKQCIEWPWS
jgi:hypoxanthine phosphoribosyltransferase